MATDADTIIDTPAADPVETPPAPAPATPYPDDLPREDDAPAPDAQPEDTDADAGDDPAPEPIAAPVSWAKDAKETFGKLIALGDEGRQIAETIVQREVERERSLQVKFREAANTRQAVETEARTALQTITRNYEQQLTQFMPPEPQAPDLRLLNSNDPAHRDLYFQQEAAYRADTAQRAQIAQQLEATRQQAGTLAEQQLQAEIAVEEQRLVEELGTEWSDPSARAKLLDTLQPIAAELGYSPEVMAQARADDILALRRIGDLKAKADKYDQLMKRRMEPVRAAKPALPNATRPGAPTGNAPRTGTLAALYPDDVPRN